MNRIISLNQCRFHCLEILHMAQASQLAALHVDKVNSVNSTEVL